MQRGVGDFVEKPWSNSRLLEILERQIEIGRQKKELRRRDSEKERVQHEIASHAEQQEREIAEALRIQQGFLPHRIPQISGYQIEAAWQPARIVAGDYYDVVAFGDDAVGLCIADVAGKGLPAAMLMSNLQAAVRGLASPAISPERLCERLNTVVSRNIANDKFITLFYAYLDGPTRRLRYANAGHNSPIVVHADGSFTRLREGGGVLGVFELQPYVMGVQDLVSGDRVVLFTDGVTEACGPTSPADADGEEFGEARLLDVIIRNRQAGAEQLRKIILNAVEQHCRGIWNDDATLVVVAVE